MQRCVSTTGILKGHYYDAHKITMCFTKPISTQSELPKIYSEEIEERHAVNYTIENVGQNNDGFDSACKDSNFGKISSSVFCPHNQGIGSSNFASIGPM